MKNQQVAQLARRSLMGVGTLAVRSRKPGPLTGWRPTPKQSQDGIRIPFHGNQTLIAQWEEEEEAHSLFQLFILFFHNSNS